MLLAAMTYAMVRGRRSHALCAGAAMICVPVLVVPLKLLLARPGPLTDATGYYPSGHTATALVAYCGAALLVHRRLLLPVAAFAVAATGCGLVLRGYHWPLDVAGSVLLFTGSWLLLAAMRRRRSSGRTPSRRSGPS
ncbi:hypothetical protein BJP39_26255 [Streptomyces sp. CC77]|nr:hypothetical protein BJP39_26255 [Streptomyces sp. CC77]